MRIFHSVWTEPMKLKRWHITEQVLVDIWFFALSTHYVKMHGHEMVLHTDKLGEKIYGTLPYDEVHLTLENNNYLPLFWASGKILAQEQEPIGAVHIDGDVHLSKPEVFSKIQEEDYDVLIQNDENFKPVIISAREIIRPYMVKKFKRYNFLFNHSFKSHNCGVVCFKNRILKDEYVHSYKEIVEYLSRSNKLRMDVERHIKHGVPDLLTEQMLLRNLAEIGNYKVARMLDIEEDDQFHQLVTIIEDLGYVHYKGPYKYNKVQEVKDELKKENPELYKKVECHINKIKEEVYNNIVKIQL